MVGNIKLFIGKDLNKKRIGWRMVFWERLIFKIWGLEFRLRSNLKGKRYS